jgi:hypothetical protein
MGGAKGISLGNGRRFKEDPMQTTILKVIGAALIVAYTVQMAAATEHHERRYGTPPVEQFRNSNAYYAAPEYALPENYVLQSPTWSEEVESAMTSGIAGD